MMQEKISIIVPIYNSEKYLKECIESIISQTYKNLEILLIDDGSTDKSTEILKSFALLDKRIKFVTKHNTGVADTRNYGINISSGKYIMFIDSDDFIDNTYVNDMYNELKNNKYDFITSGMTFCNQFGKKNKESLYINKNTRLYFEDIIQDVINSLYFCSSCKTLISKKFVLKNKIKFNKELNYGEDLTFSFDLMKFSKNFGYLSNCGYFYRQNYESVTHENDIDKIYVYFYNNLNVFSGFNSYIKDDTTIANRLFTKTNITIKKIALIDNINFKMFKKNANKILWEFYNNQQKGNIKITSIYYEKNIDKLLLVLLKYRLLYLYYFIVKNINVIKKLIRK